MIRVGGQVMPVMGDYDPEVRAYLSCTPAAAPGCEVPSLTLTLTLTPILPLILTLPYPNPSSSPSTPPPRPTAILDRY